MILRIGTGAGFYPATIVWQPQKLKSNPDVLWGCNMEQDVKSSRKKVSFASGI